MLGCLWPNDGNIVASLVKLSYLYENERENVMDQQGNAMKGVNVEGKEKGREKDKKEQER